MERPKTRSMRNFLIKRFAEDKGIEYTLKVDFKMLGQKLTRYYAIQALTVHAQAALRAGRRIDIPGVEVLFLDKPVY